MKIIARKLFAETASYDSPKMRVKVLSARRALCQSPGTEDYREGKEYDEEDMW